MNRYIIDREKYFCELAETSEKFFIKYIERFKTIDSNCRILEIGCGEGGNLLPFAKRNCHVVGIDLSRHKIEEAKFYFVKRSLKGVFYCEDFLKTNYKTSPDDLYDVIIIHDVIEHIEPTFKIEFLGKTIALLKPNGVVFCGFPPWQMPFGGHQQICKSKVCSKLPLVHLLPQSIYRAYLDFFGEDANCISELLSIKRSKMTIESFEGFCRKTDFKIIDRMLWLINPHYSAKFNLRPRKLPQLIGKVPYVRNYFTTACFYILGHIQ